MVTHGATQNIKSIMAICQIDNTCKYTFVCLTRLSFPVIVRRRLQFSKLLFTYLASNIRFLKKVISKLNQMI